MNIWIWLALPATNLGVIIISSFTLMVFFALLGIEIENIVEKHIKAYEDRIMKGRK
jgi:hypothetical protein